MTIEEKIRRAKADYDAVYEAGFHKGTEQGGGSNAAYEELVNKVKVLNTELATSLYGGDTASERTLEENVRQANSDFVAIKEKIVECGVEVSDGTHTRDYAPKVRAVYEAGKKSQYDEFWDNYQDYGNRKIYRQGFAGAGWSQETLKPKYKIKPSTKSYSTGAQGIFQYCGWVNNPIDFSLIDMDFSDCTRGDDLFMNSNALKIVVDLSTFVSLRQCFMCNDGGEIYDITLKVSELCTDYNSTFAYCSKLSNLIFVEGSVIAGSINLQWSTLLSKASIISIINALSTTMSGLTLTLSKTAVETAFGSTTSTEWTSLIATRSNWTISIV